MRKLQGKQYSKETSQNTVKGRKPRDHSKKRLKIYEIWLMTDCEEYIEFCSDLRETEGAA